MNERRSEEMRQGGNDGGTVGERDTERKSESKGRGGTDGEINYRGG